MHVSLRTIAKAAARAGAAFGLGLGLLLAVPALAQRDVAPAGEPVTLIIGLDLSASNPLVDDMRYSQKVGAKVAERIADLPFRSVVKLRTFGVYSGASNPINYDITISARERPDDTADFLGRLIGAVPYLVETGRLEKQQKTNILPFLENLSQVVDCHAGPVVIVLATDGIEDSEYARLIDRNSRLPMPGAAIFEDCTELQMLGLGQGAGSPALTDRLREIWAEWAAAAGFERFSGLNDW